MPVDPLSLFVLPLILALTALFAATAAYDFIIFRRRKNINKAVVYRCDACRHIYTVPCRIPLARCPKCGKQNEPIKT
jgi:hypothetical protein